MTAIHIALRIEKLLLFNRFEAVFDLENRWSREDRDTLYLYKICISTTNQYNWNAEERCEALAETLTQKVYKRDHI